MSTEMEKLSKDDILKKFLVTDNYGENGWNWPSETVAACKIICTDRYNHEWVSHQVYRNELKKRHAEVRLIEYLRSHPLVTTSKKTIIEVYINYSPCSSCATAILEYIEGIEEEEEREVEMTITFANFYKTHAYPGNSQEVANANIVGLKGLYQHPQVQLRLFGVHVGWEGFLGMSEFFNLDNNNEKKECSKKAKSQEKKDREEQDQEFFDEIFAGVEDITLGMQNMST